MPFACPLGQPSVRASPTDPLATRRRATVRTLNPLPATSGERRSGGASRRDTRRRSSHGAVLGVPAEPGARSPHHVGSHAWRGGLVCVAISFTVGVARASHRPAIAPVAFPSHPGTVLAVSFRLGGPPQGMCWVPFPNALGDCSGGDDSFSLASSTLWKSFETS